MEKSILKTVKSYLGFSPDVDSGYDNEIILTINSVLSTLYNIGVGVDKFNITSDKEIWTDFYPNIASKSEIIEYVNIRCLLLLNPPDSIKMIEALNYRVNEITFYLNE